MYLWKIHTYYILRPRALIVIVKTGANVARKNKEKSPPPVSSGRLVSRCGRDTAKTALSRSLYPNLIFFCVFVWTWFRDVCSLVPLSPRSASIRSVYFGFQRPECVRSFSKRCFVIAVSGWDPAAYIIRINKSNENEREKCIWTEGLWFKKKRKSSYLCLPPPFVCTARSISVFSIKCVFS